MKNKNLLWIIGIMIVILIVVGGIYFYNLNKNNNVEEGIYINENNQTLRCTIQRLDSNNLNYYQIVAYYDESNNLIGNCKSPRGPYSNNKCSDHMICDSPRLYNNISDGECKGYRNNKYSCNYS
jgi:hypothetical protein